jgi:hypothetical protein
MYNEQLENLISAALADGELTEKEKQILFKRAEAMGIDLDEFEMVLDARIVAIKKEEAAQAAAAQAAAAAAAAAAAPAAPKSDKFGDIRKCPACGAMLQSFQTTCADCGYEFKNVESVQSAQKLFDQLQAAELRKSDKLSQHEIEKQRRLNELSQRHNSDGTLVKLFGGANRRETQDEEREDLIRELNKGVEVIERDAMNEKRNIIKNFPVPNAKEDLLELLAMASSNAYDNDGCVGPEEEVWIQKTDQIYQKIIVCAAKDKPFLTQATNMIVSLMKKLPRKYKKFTQIPTEMVGMVQEGLKQEQDAKKQLLIDTFKKWGSIAGGCFLLSIIMGVIPTDFTATVSIFCAIAGIVVAVLGVRSFKRQKDIF